MAAAETRLIKLEEGDSQAAIQELLQKRRVRHMLGLRETLRLSKSGARRPN